MRLCVVFIRGRYRSSVGVIREKESDVIEFVSNLTHRRRRRRFVVVGIIVRTVDARHLRD